MATVQTLQAQNMNFTKPVADQVFKITADADWPDMVFETDAAGLPHSWQWTVTWKTFKQSGTATSPGNSWNAKAALTGMGGELAVVASVKRPNTAAAEDKKISVKIRGTNPSVGQITAYLGTQSGSDGFGAIISHESKNKHFDNDEPVKSFDNGYGMCQLTTPTPSFVQVWNWKRNIDAGLVLFGQKRTAAINYLSQSGRTYTTDQLKYETVCRWNGGAYHVWDDTAKKWVRPSAETALLCDAKTGNIGWDMGKTENAGKTEATLRARDKSEYAKPPTKDANWRYSGVCYADQILQ